ncbi:MAG TPA: hypothetical protein PKA63_10070 [Oligoflexia bacterium]|nr:hypothetical protein [Oligoflexia bacterium]HMP49002.1 hypothetical protein [Oligoflexia bacterium]
MEIISFFKLFWVLPISFLAKSRFSIFNSLYPAFFLVILCPTISLSQETKTQLSFEEEDLEGFTIYKKPCLNFPVTTGYIKEFDNDEESNLLSIKDHDLLCNTAGIALSQIRQLLALPEINYQLSLLVVSESHFFKEIEAPIWAEALSVDGVIYLPRQYLDAENIKKTIHHEVLHSVVYQIAGNRVPAWLEEGLAQIVSGQVEPKLFKTRKMNKFGSAPIRKLHNGGSYHTREEADIAYGLSVQAVSLLSQDHGFATFGAYLGKLALGHSHARAFESTFNMSEAELERTIKNEASKTGRAMPQSDSASRKNK